MQATKYNYLQVFLFSLNVLYNEELENLYVHNIYVLYVFFYLHHKM